MIKKILSGIALATALAFNTNAQESKIVDFHPEILAVAKEGKPITRGSLDVEFNKYDSDLFLFGQREGDSDFYKARIQYRPLELGNVSIGGTIQTSGVRDLFHSEDAGIALRAVGSPISQSFGLAELRYFPKNELIESRGILDTKKVYGEYTLSHNLDTRDSDIILGIDYKLTKDWFVGLETEFSGKNLDLKEKYTGVRAGFRF